MTMQPIAAEDVFDVKESQYYKTSLFLIDCSRHNGTLSVCRFERGSILEDGLLQEG